MRALALILGLILSACTSNLDTQDCTPVEGAATGAGQMVLEGLGQGLRDGGGLNVALGTALGVVLAPVGAILGALSCDKNSSPVNVISPEATKISPEELKRMAKNGDAGAQYSLGLSDALTDAERWKWSCLAAQQDHASAQALIGYKYKTGHFVGVDVVEAYLWFKLALANGLYSATWHIDDLAKTMTPDQIAEAERLVREWQPDPSSCDLEVNQAAGGV